MTTTVSSILSGAITDIDVEFLKEKLAQPAPRSVFCHALDLKRQQDGLEISSEAMARMVEVSHALINGVDNHFDVWNGRQLMLLSQHFYTLDGDRDDEGTKKIWLQAKIYHHRFWNRVPFWEECILCCVAEEAMYSAFARRPEVSTVVSPSCTDLNTSALDKLSGHMRKFGIGSPQIRSLVQKVVDRNGFSRSIRDRLLAFEPQPPTPEGSPDITSSSGVAAASSSNAVSPTLNAVSTFEAANAGQPFGGNLLSGVNMPINVDTQQLSSAASAVQNRISAVAANRDQIVNDLNKEASKLQAHGSEFVAGAAGAVDEGVQQAFSWGLGGLEQLRSTVAKGAAAIQSQVVQSSTTDVVPPPTEGASLNATTTNSSGNLGENAASSSNLIDVDVQIDDALGTKTKLKPHQPIQVIDDEPHVEQHHYETPTLTEAIGSVPSVADDSSASGFSPAARTLSSSEHVQNQAVSSDQKDSPNVTNEPVVSSSLLDSPALAPAAAPTPKLEKPAETPAPAQPTAHATADLLSLDMSSPPPAATVTPVPTTVSGYNTTPNATTNIIDSTIQNAESNPVPQAVKSKTVDLLGLDDGDDDDVDDGADPFA